MFLWCAVEQRVSLEPCWGTMVNSGFSWLWIGPNHSVCVCHYTIINKGPFGSWRGGGGQERGGWSNHSVKGVSIEEALWVEGITSVGLFWLLLIKLYSVHNFCGFTGTTLWAICSTADAWAPWTPPAVLHTEQMGLGHVWIPCASTITKSSPSIIISPKQN